MCRLSLLLALVGVFSLLAAGADCQADFTLKMTVDCANVREREVLCDGGSFSLQFRMAGRDKDLWVFDHWHQRYLARMQESGECPIIEAIVPNARRARIISYDDGMPKGQRIGIPLWALPGTNRFRTVSFSWRKTALHLLIDGVEDLDFMVAPLEKAILPVKVESRRVRSAKVLPPETPVEPACKPIAEPIQYWTAGGFNTWVGDVTLYTWRGRLHVFFLKDRRHHRSKGASGGHFFAHVSSPDLIHWDEHPVVTPVDEYWFTCGTGNPFEFNGKLCLTYGIHATRFVTREETTEPKMLAELKANGGVMPAYRFKGTDLIPLGATWASSADGFVFERSGIVYHTTQNPAIENLPDGSLRLTTGFAGDTGVNGVWRRDAKTEDGILDGWRKTDETVPLKGDCPCPFEWHGWRYLLQGFSGYAIARPKENFRPANGSDIYDGLSVPMVAKWGKDRRLMAGWIPYPYKRGWGGWLVFRELVWRDDGSIGSKFAEEIKPPSPMHERRASGGERMELRFKPVSGSGGEVAFVVEPKRQRAFATDVGTDGTYGKLLIHHSAYAFEVTNVRNLDRDYVVRYVVHYDRKADATIFDFEIAGNRTLIIRRNGRWAISMRK